MGAKKVPTAASGICSGEIDSTVNSDLNSGAFLASTLCRDPAGLAVAELALGPVPPLAFAATAAVPAADPAAAAAVLLAMVPAGDIVSGRSEPLTPAVPSEAVLGVLAAGPDGRSWLLPAAASAPVPTAAAAACPMPDCLVIVFAASAARPAPNPVDGLAPFVTVPAPAAGCLNAVLVAGIQEVSAAGERSCPCACVQTTDDVA